MKIKVHPLFAVCGLLSALFGGLPVFCLCVLTALLHECGHIFYAERLGYSCLSVSLMPYGAAASYDLDGLTTGEEIRLALAGPLVNALLCVALAGLWWFFPQTYGWTDTLMQSNVAMLAVNLLPAAPLDGGRVVECLIENRWDVRLAHRIGTVLTILCAIGCAGVGVWQRNVSLGSMSLFLLASLKSEKPSFCPLLPPKTKPKDGGREIKLVLITPDTTYRQALHHLNERYYLIFQAWRDGNVTELTEEELYDRLPAHSLNDRVIDG